MAYDEDEAYSVPNLKDLLVALGVILSAGLLVVLVLAYIVSRK